MADREPDGHYLKTEELLKAFERVNSQGFASIDLSRSLPADLGLPLYQAMEARKFNSKNYYNEFAFYWPADWKGVERGISQFHDDSTVKSILSDTEASTLMRELFGEHLAACLLEFAWDIKTQIANHHHGLDQNELRLSRVMVRQMNERFRTQHGATNWHEDVGYSDRPFRQLLSAVITTVGQPTAGQRYTSKLGELLIFNASDRRRLLGLGEDLAFIHRGPASGPKMFFFFEFLGPRF